MLHSRSTLFMNSTTWTALGFLVGVAVGEFLPIGQRLIPLAAVVGAAIAVLVTGQLARRRKNSVVNNRLETITKELTSTEINAMDQAKREAAKRGRFDSKPAAPASPPQET
ncbi:hypothetical protein Pan216_31270 [Planctomycetes bacterium Pan216]|uniref:Uncharacterized protein n=1 Tax=Kolteria novifilia TaxID=2527975 RepID=A0A518B5K6_9BACT|nr:hypothetical protein Pan216_31270 [Planctomycetes bacterium Pan216]